MKKPKLVELRDYLSGRADPVTRKRIGAELRDETSELRQLLEGVREASSLLLGWGLTGDQVETPEEGVTELPAGGVSMVPEFRSVTQGEVECLMALWMAQEEAKRQGRATKKFALGFDDIESGVSFLYEGVGRQPPDVAAVSLALKGLEARGGLLEVVRLPRSKVGAPAGVRSPQTAYRALCSPAQVFGQEFEAFARAYPGRRWQALLEFAKQKLGRAGDDSDGP